MLDDPLRAQSLSLIAGAILAVIVIAGCAILAVLRPQGALGSAPIVMSRETGALYVRIDETMHPVWNLASARMIAGTPADPEVVAEAAILAARRGPPVGIPGAPAVIGTPLSSAGWTVCDASAGTTVGTGIPDVPGDRLGAERGVLVTPRGESAAISYLLYDGRRAAVDLRNTAVVRALRLDTIVPQPVSRALLDIVPEVPAIAAPVIAGLGSPGPREVDGIPVGTVVKMVRAGTVEHYIVLADGIQQIGELTADLIRFTITQPDREIPTIAADAVAAAAVVHVLPVGTHPDRMGVAPYPVVCARWSAGADGRYAEVELVGASAVPHHDLWTTALAQADGTGPNVDSVVVPGGRSGYLRSTDATGAGGAAAPRYLIDDRGVLYGIRDDQTAQHLGLPGPAVAAPWPLLAWLPRGPELSEDGASVLRDTIGAAGAAR